MSTKFKSMLSNAKTNNQREVYISLVGAPGVGKSALMVKYITRRFIGEYDPIYEGIWHKNEIIDGKEVIVQIYDTYDKERKHLEKYIKWSDYVVLMYSVTNHDSFLEAQKYLDTMQDLIFKYSLDELNNGMPIKVLLLGTKLDLERYREVNKQDVQSVIERYSSKISSSTSHDCYLVIQSMETTSCEEYELVKNVFLKIVKEIKRDREQQQQHQQQQQQNNTINNNSSSSNVNNNHTNCNQLQVNSNDDMINHHSSLNANLTTTNSKSKSNLTYSKSRSKSPRPSGGAFYNGNNSNDSSSNQSLANQNNSVDTTTSNGQSYPSTVATSTSTTNVSIKKPGSKFPFFTKILNKS